MVDKAGLKKSVVTSDKEKKQSIPWWRVGTGTVLGLMTLVTVTVGLSLISDRLTHTVVENGSIEGRVTQLRSPIDGNIKAYYARPGLSVSAGQILARIGADPSPQQEQIRLQLERSQEDRKQLLNRLTLERLQIQGELQTNSSQLAAAEQTLRILQSQLLELENKNQALNRVNVELANKEVTQSKAALEAANAKATAARLDFERYRQLVNEGVVPQQEVDRMRYTWQSAEAEVKQAQADLDAALDSLRAYQNGVTINENATTLWEKRTNLMQTIQSQSALVATLRTQIESGRQRLRQAEALRIDPMAQSLATTRRYLSRQDYEVVAPFSGIVYKTDREAGEQINRTEPILTLIDCNELWVEAIIPAEEMNAIDTQKPIKVQIAGYNQTFAGEIDLIQPVGGVSAAQQLPTTHSQALSESVPPNLAGKPLVRVTVRIPSLSQYLKSNQFCGIGQLTRLTFAKKAFSFPNLSFPVSN